VVGRIRFALERFASPRHRSHVAQLFSLGALAHMQLPSRYSYNPRWRGILAGAVFFGGCSAFMAHEAIHNGVGLIINGIFRLGPEAATMFYWCIAALGGMFVLMALLLTVRRIANPQVLVFETDAFLLPHGFLQTHISRISYTDIQDVSEVQVSRQTFLYITAYGRRFTITASLLPDTSSYVAIKDFLLSNARH
jgi:hypothetical protein